VTPNRRRGRHAESPVLRNPNEVVTSTQRNSEPPPRSPPGVDVTPNRRRGRHGESPVLRNANEVVTSTQRNSEPPPRSPSAVGGTRSRRRVRQIHWGFFGDSGCWPACPAALRRRPPEPKLLRTARTAPPEPKLLRTATTALAAVEVTPKPLRRRSLQSKLLRTATTALTAVEVTPKPLRRRPPESKLLRTATGSSTDSPLLRTVIWSGINPNRGRRHSSGYCPGGLKSSPRMAHECSVDRSHARCIPVGFVAPQLHTSSMRRRRASPSPGASTATTDRLSHSRALRTAAAG
jgi:hypothetical protein